MYTTSIAHHGLQFHLVYADDSQLYASFKTDSNQQLLTAKYKVELCVRDIDNRMVHNGLKLNQNISELLVCSSKFWTVWKLYMSKYNPVHLQGIQVSNLTCLSLNEHITELFNRLSFKKC